MQAFIFPHTILMIPAALLCMMPSESLKYVALFFLHKASAVLCTRARNYLPNLRVFITQPPEGDPFYQIAVSVNKFQPGFGGRGILVVYYMSYTGIVVINKIRFDIIEKTTITRVMPGIISFYFAS